MMMNKFKVVVLSILLFSSSSWGDEAADHLRENSAGMNVLVVGEIPTVIENVKIETPGSSLLLVDFPGTGDYASGGVLFTISWKNTSSLADTLWRFWPSWTASEDSSYVLLEPGSGNARIGFIAEGDMLRIDKMAAGETLLYLGGSKNLRGATADDF